MDEEIIDLTNDDSPLLTSSNLAGILETMESKEPDQYYYQQGELGTRNDPANISAARPRFRDTRPLMEGIRSRTVSPEPRTSFARREQKPGRIVYQELEATDHCHLEKSTGTNRVTFTLCNHRTKRSISFASQSEDDTSPVQPAKRRKMTISSGEKIIINIDENSDEDENEAAPPAISQVRSNTTKKATESDRFFPHMDIEDDEREGIIIDNDEGEEIADDAIYSSPHRLQVDDDDIQLISTISRTGARSATGSRIITKIKKNGTTCAPGKTVELDDGSFMRIVTMMEDRNGDIRIIGHLFRRHNKLECSKWPRRSNELVLISVTTRGRPVELTTVSLADVRRNRHLILTNNIFPFVSLKTHPDAFPSNEVSREYGPLFCRWKHRQVLNDQGKFIEESIERLSFAEADDGYQKADSHIRRGWRRPRVDLGHKQTAYAHFRQQRKPSETVQYTFADAFCGAGGASCAADEAGLAVKWGVDHNEAAIRTYALNFAFKGTDCLHQDIHDFIIQTRIAKRSVDILHISPPCQPYSPAHTVSNVVQDEKNQATLFSVGELLETVRPRVVTLEETFGLLSRHKDWFNALIKMFLDRNYSVRWTCAKLQEYGLPQKRRRLLILAAAPGETLPPFPKATHSDDGVLKPFNTIHSTIKDILENAANHNVRAVAYKPQDCKRPFGPNVLARTITCSGGQDNYHPSGQRGYTIREYASLQCFPMSYRFADVGVTAQRRQIGNAVPPFVFKKIYREIIKSLRETDREG